MRSASVSASTPAFEAVYAPISGECRIAASDATFRRYPRRASICSITARSVRQTPRRLTASVRSICSIGLAARPPTKLESCVRDRDVDPAEALDSPVHGATQRIEVGDIRLEPRRALGSEPRNVLLQALGLEPHERDVCTLAVHALGSGRADAARGASDEDRAALDVVPGGARAHRAPAGVGAAISAGLARARS